MSEHASYWVLERMRQAHERRDPHETGYGAERGLSRQEGETINVAFPRESTEYRAACNRLLEQEVELRRTMEAVAAARRELPPGGPVPEDYLFRGAAKDGAPTDVQLSELFAAGKRSLVIYSFMFPRDPGD